MMDEMDDHHNHINRCAENGQVVKRMSSPSFSPVTMREL
jgi:hypothetical protein